MGKLKWVLCGFCILLSLGAIGASEKYIGEGRWEWQQQRFCSVCYFISDFQGSSESITEEKSQEIACWFESYAQNTVSFEKLEQELGKGAVKIWKNLLPGDISGISR